ncbi:MAG: cupin domain-containing protein [Hyphomicrobiaceae bacterium]
MVKRSKVKAQAARPAVKSSARKAKPKVIRFEDVPFKPRFAYGDQAQIGNVTGSEQGAEFGYGFARMTNAKIPWTITYDEILLVISGVLRVRIASKVLEAGPGDSIWLPAGTELVYECESCLMAYAIHPIGAAPSAAKR